MKKIIIFITILLLFSCQKDNNNYNLIIKKPLINTISERSNNVGNNDPIMCCWDYVIPSLSCPGNNTKFELHFKLPNPYYHQFNTDPFLFNKNINLHDICYINAIIECDGYQFPQIAEIKFNYDNFNSNNSILEGLNNQFYSNIINYFKNSVIINKSNNITYVGGAGYTVYNVCHSSLCYDITSTVISSSGVIAFIKYSDSTIQYLIDNYEAFNNEIPILYTCSTNNNYTYCCHNFHESTNNQTCYEIYLYGKIANPYFHTFNNDPIYSNLNINTKQFCYIKIIGTGCAQYACDIKFNIDNYNSDISILSGTENTQLFLQFYKFFHSCIRYSNSSPTFLNNGTYTGYKFNVCTINTLTDFSMSSTVNYNITLANGQSIFVPNNFPNLFNFGNNICN